MPYTNPVTSNDNDLDISLSPSDASYSTPPPLHRLSRYGNRVPLPPQIECAVSLNPALEHTDTPVLNYNLLDHPRNAGVNYYHQLWHMQEWVEKPATSPALSDITIRVPNLDRPIVVHAREPGSQGRYGAVTIIDVLTTLHHELRVEAVKDIYGAQTRSNILWEDPRCAYPERPEVDIQSAVTSILGGRTFWDGLTPSDQERDVWILHVR